MTGDTEQFNGREGETATLLFGVICFPDVARGGFAPRHLSRSALSGGRGRKLDAIYLRDGKDYYRNSFSCRSD